MKNTRCFFLILILFAQLSSIAATGCRVSGGNLIYTNFSPYTLGVDIGSGLSLALGGRLYNLSPTINSNISCTVPWAKNVNTIAVNGCIYGNPSINIPPLSAVCLTCQYGDLVDYTSTLECNLDDYSWLLGSAAAAFAFIVIRRKRNE